MNVCVVDRFNNKIQERRNLTNIFETTIRWKNNPTSSCCTPASMIVFIFFFCCYFFRRYNMYLTIVVNAFRWPDKRSNSLWGTYSNKFYNHFSTLMHIYSLSYRKYRFLILPVRSLINRTEGNLSADLWECSSSPSLSLGTG